MANEVTAEDKLKQIRMVLDRVGERICAIGRAHGDYPVALILTAMSEGLDEIEAVIRLEQSERGN